MDEQISYTERISGAIDHLCVAQGSLEKVLLHEHGFINGSIPTLCSDVRSAGYVVSDEHRKEALRLAGFVMHDSLHVEGKAEYEKGYYQKFITDPSTEFELRYSFVRAMMYFLSVTDSVRGTSDLTFPKVLVETYDQVLIARSKLKKGSSDVSPAEAYYLVKDSYYALESLRGVIKEEYGWRVNGSQNTPETPSQLRSADINLQKRAPSNKKKRNFRNKNRRKK